MPRASREWEERGGGHVGGFDDAGAPEWTEVQLWIEAQIGPEY